KGLQVAYALAGRWPRRPAPARTPVGLTLPWSQTTIAVSPGILRPAGSADDRAIFFSLPSFWGMNEVARKTTVKPLTAVFVRPKRMSDLPSLHRELNVSADTQAVLPSGVLLTIFKVMALAEEGLTMILAIVGAVMVLYVFVSMYSATLERKREIATMR